MCFVAMQGLILQIFMNIRSWDFEKVLSVLSLIIMWIQ